MPLIVDNRPVLDELQTRHEAVFRVPAIAEANKRFASTPPVEITGSTRAVTVLQGEVAVVPWGDADYVCTTDATTCIMAILVSDHGVAIAHFDEDNMYMDDYMGRFLNSVRTDADQTAHLYLVGGYEDEGLTDYSIYTALVDKFSTVEGKIVLEAAIVGSANTHQVTRDGKTIPCPLFSGACFKTSANPDPALPAPFFPAKVVDKGPLTTLRTCRMMCLGQTLDIYDAQT